jgi:hypothetical protein
MSDIEEWSVDLTRKTATHTSGYSLTVEGSLQDPSSVSPGRTPAGLSAHDQVRLLREGLDVLAKNAKDNPIEAASESSGPSIRKLAKSTYQRPENLARKPLLTLKKRS